MSGTTSDNPLARVLSGTAPPSIGSTGAGSESAAPLAKAGAVAELGGTYGSQEIWRALSAQTAQQVSGMIGAGFTFPEIMAFMSRRRRDIAEEQGLAEKIRSQAEHESRSGETRKTPKTEREIDEEDKNKVRKEAARVKDVEKFGRTRTNWRDTLRAEFGSDADFYIESALEEGGERGAAIRTGDKTPIIARYREAGLACKAAFTSGAIKVPSDDFLPERVTNVQASTHQTAWSGDLVGYRCTGLIGSKRVPLTATVFPMEGSKAGRDDAMIGMWLHTPGEVVAEIMSHVASLQDELLPRFLDAEGTTRVGEPKDPGKAVNLVARIAWWMCHAMPQPRGSASLVEWYVEAALAQCNVDLGQRMGPLDLTAFQMSEAEFAKTFCNLFKAKFTPPRPSEGKEATESAAAPAPDPAYRREIDALRLLQANNCLINAITTAAGLPRATEPQLIEIRGRLNNIGQMMVASPNTIGVIREVLGVTRPINVNYPAGILPEAFIGNGGEPLEIRHTGAAHFVAGRDP